MDGLAFLLGWAAYAGGGYGYVLLRGWNIPFREWVSPLDPYQWPAGGPPPIPDTIIFPGQKPSASTGGGTGSAAPSGSSGTGTGSTPPAGSSGGGNPFWNGVGRIFHFIF